MRKAIRILLLLLPALPCRAQLYASAGAGLGYPLLFTHANTMLNAGHISDDIHAGLTLRPADALFFPSVQFSYGAERLPQQEAGQRIAIFKYTHAGAMFREYCAVPGSRWLIHCGIGIVLLTEKAPAPDNSVWVTTFIDSAKFNKVFPAINMGTEYAPAQNSGHRCYLAIGADVQYLLLPHDGNTAYITVSGAGGNSHSYRASLSGSLIVPTVYVALHCRLRIKQSGMYMD